MFKGKDYVFVEILGCSREVTSPTNGPPRHIHLSFTVNYLNGNQSHLYLFREENDFISPKERPRGHGSGRQDRKDSVYQVKDISCQQVQDGVPFVFCRSTKPISPTLFPISLLVSSTRPLSGSHLVRRKARR